EITCLAHRSVGKIVVIAASCQTVEGESLYPGVDCPILTSCQEVVHRTQPSANKSIKEPARRRGTPSPVPLSDSAQIHQAFREEKTSLNSQFRFGWLGDKQVDE